MKSEALETRLTRIDERAAGVQSAAIAAFNGQVLGDWRIRARAARPDHDALGWLRFDAGGNPLALAPLVVAGKVARTVGPEGSGDALAAAASLVDLEPIVALIEEAFALPLHPTGLDAAPPADAVTIELSALDPAGEIAARVLLAIPVDFPGQPVPPRAVPLPPGLRLPWRAIIEGPALTGAEAGRLEKGGLLLLGTIVSAALLFLPGRRGAARATVDLSQNTLRIDAPADEGGLMLDEDAVALRDADKPDAPARVDAVLPTMIELPGGTVRASELASLGEGSVLPIDAAGGTLKVRVSVDGNAVADGELVALGQGYAVLVTALLDTPQN